MIAAPTTDRACLDQLTRLARELVPTTLVRTVAARLGSKASVVAWLQSLPQSDDDGEESYRAIACDVNQRTRLFPDDPNCFERSFAALTLLEVLDPKTTRMLVTIERPQRHTGVVERRGKRWVALDLFPRRNGAADTGKDILQGIHKYIGKPLMSAYGLGGIADKLGDAEDAAIGRAKKQPSPSTPAESEPRARTEPVTKQINQGGGANDEKETRAQNGVGAPSGGAAGSSLAVGPTVSSAEAVEEEESQRWGWG